MNEAFLVAAMFAQVPFGFLVESEQAKRDAMVHQAVERFFAAWDSRDVDALMKLVEVPCCADTRVLIDSKDRLRKVFEGDLKGKAKEQGKVHIRRVATLKELRAEGKSPPVRRVSWGEVLGKEGVIVRAEKERPSGKLGTVWVGIRFENGAARIVGVAD